MELEAPTSGRRKPVIFIASSSEASDLLSEISVFFATEKWCLVRPWHLSFEPGKSFLGALLDTAQEIDFALIVYTGDDRTSSRGVVLDSPRDNVVFELGFFIAKLGPEKVIALATTNVPKIPSDYLGHTLLTFDPSSGRPTDYLYPAVTKAIQHFKHLWQKQQARSQINAVSSESVQNVDIVYRPSGGGPIPIYRDISSHLDWFSEFEAGVRPPFRYLNSKLSYYGPDLAKFWFQLARQDAANMEMSAILQKELHTLLDDHRYPSVNIVDLGIGDFEKGHIVLDYFLKEPAVQAINYFPLDISYDMLTQALQTRVDHYAATTLRAVQETGSITAINAPFSQLSRYKHLFSPPSKNIFLLLGNTLGNEAVESEVLNQISDAMDPGDILIVEVQLLELEPPTADEDKESLQKHKDFFCGPFAAVGYDPRNIDLNVRSYRSKDKTRSIAAVTTEVTATLNKKLVASHPSFREKKLSIEAGETVVTHLIRLYDEGAVDKLLQQAGFELIKVENPSPRHKRARRFSYLVARK